VRDAGIEGRDPVADEPFTTPPVPLGAPSSTAGGFERADDPRSWEPPLPISERALARKRMRRQRAEFLQEQSPFYRVVNDPGFVRVFSACVGLGAVLILRFFGWAGFIPYVVLFLGLAIANRVCVKRRQERDTGGGPLGGVGKPGSGSRRHDRLRRPRSPIR
jgi:hypothetical protein